MNTTLSLPADSLEGWLVVIDRFEASVFRSVQPDAVPQVIRSQRSGPEADGQEHFALPGYFEPLVGILSGARRILVASRTAAPGDEANQFVAWLRAYHPAIGRRIAASLSMDPDRNSDDDILAKARVFYKRGEAIRSAFSGVRGLNLSATRRPAEQKRTG